MKTVDKEDYLIDRLTSKHIGDDGAVIGDTVYSTDAFHEGVHFLREWMTPAQIARKAMLVNISDAIAMSAQPRYALLSISIPRDMTLGDIDEMMASFESTASEYGCEIIGGDTERAHQLKISITNISKSTKPLTREGLDHGDILP